MKINLKFYQKMREEKYLPAKKMVLCQFREKLFENQFRRENF
jgi:hypothetical protein